MSDLRVWVQGVGLLGPGLESWAAAIEVLRGTQRHVFTPTVLSVAPVDLSRMRTLTMEKASVSNSSTIAMAAA